MEAVKLLSPSDIAELGLTKGQNKLLSKAVNELRAPAQPAKLTEPITTTSLADQGLDELIKKLDNGGGLDALVSCGGLDDLPQSFHSTIPPAGQAQGDTTRVDLNPLMSRFARSCEICDFSCAREKSQKSQSRRFFAFSCDFSQFLVLLMT